jgi:hypothetical protein
MTTNVTSPDASPALDGSLLARVESLGDNCELGYFQRHRGHEVSTLFRWTVTPIESLIRYLDEPGDLYDLADLTPHAPFMVTDAGYGFKFHSTLVERTDDGGLQLLSDEARRLEVHAQERAKIDHLSEKFWDRLRNQPTVYVVKRNDGLTEDSVTRLRDRLLGYNPDHALLWVTAGGAAAPMPHSRGLWTARLDRFATYSEADNYDAEGWSLIHENLPGGQRA